MGAYRKQLKEWYKMRIKKVCSIIAVCIAVMLCLCPLAYAEEIYDENIIWQKDISWEWIDSSQVEFSENDIMMLSEASINHTVGAHVIKRASPLISLQARDKIVFNCTYAPSSASVDFGILTPDNKFYPISGQDGKINQSLLVSYSGDYYIAIRNNSNQSVTVTGTVT